MIIVLILGIELLSGVNNPNIHQSLLSRSSGFSNFITAHIIPKKLTTIKNHLSISKIMLIPGIFNINATIIFINNNTIAAIWFM